MEMERQSVARQLEKVGKIFKKYIGSLFEKGVYFGFVHMS